MLHLLYCVRSYFVYFTVILVLIGTVLPSECTVIVRSYFCYGFCCYGYCVKGCTCYHYYYFYRYYCSIMNCLISAIIDFIIFSFSHLLLPLLLMSIFNYHLM
jgi:hypothetical protein